MSLTVTPAITTVNTTQIAKKEKKKSFSFQNFQVGLMISLSVQPFEVIRTTSITSLKNKGGSISGTLSVIKHIYQMEGMRGFYRGGLICVAKSSLGAGVFFNGIEYMHTLTKKFRERDHIPNNVVDFCNAASARIFTTLAVSPMNVLKTRFEVVGSKQYDGIRHAISSIYKTNGLKGFYRGLVPTIIRDVPFSGIEYATYRFFLETYKKYIDPTSNPQDSSFVVFGCAGASAILAVTLTYPFDNIRVRLQCSDMNGQTTKGLGAAMSQVYREEGLRGFYLGYVPRLMKKGFSCALAWMVYERLRKDTVLH